MVRIGSNTSLQRGSEKLSISWSSPVSGPHHDRGQATAHKLGTNYTECKRTIGQWNGTLGNRSRTSLPIMAAVPLGHGPGIPCIKPTAQMVVSGLPRNSVAPVQHILVGG